MKELDRLIVIGGTPEEIAALKAEVQERQKQGREVMEFTEKFLLDFAVEIRRVSLCDL